jgi:hypothetical protein
MVETCWAVVALALDTCLRRGELFARYTGTMVQELLGHADVGMALHYSHLSPAHCSKAWRSSASRELTLLRETAAAL